MTSIFSIIYFCLFLFRENISVKSNFLRRHFIYRHRQIHKYSVNLKLKKKELKSKNRKLPTSKLFYINETQIKKTKKIRTF